MGWSELLQHPKRLTSYYEVEPDLSTFNLHEIAYHRDGPSLFIRGAVNEYASRPSPRWDPSCNTVQIVLACIELTQFSCSGTGTQIVGDLQIDRCNTSDVSFRFDAEGFLFSGQCRWLDLDNLTAYCIGNDKAESNDIS